MKKSTFLALVLLIFLGIVIEPAISTFYPSQNLNMEGFNITNLSYIFAEEFVPGQSMNLDNTYNITDGDNNTYIFADFFCYNNGTCISSINFDVGVGSTVSSNSMWGVALIMTIMGTAFLFVYISSQIGSPSDKVERPILNIFYASMKLLFIGGGLILPIVAIGANQAIWQVDGLDTSSLSIYGTDALRIAIWFPVAFISLLVIFGVIQFMLAVMDQARRRKNE